MNFTNSEGFDMLMVLGECFQNFTGAARLYAQRYPEREHPTRKTFQSLVARVRETGQVQPHHNKSKEIKRPVTGERGPEIIAAVLQNPHDSIRRISTDSGISPASICRIFKYHKMHPFRMSLHQELSENDYLCRLNFCLWARNMLGENPLFFRNVLWCDEATFRSNGEVNRHNMRYWAYDNPHWMREVDNQRYWTLNTWCGIIGNVIVGPHFFDGTLTGAVYNDFLINTLPALLMELPIQIRQNMWLLQDGAPPHFALNVRATLNQQFPERWIGRGANVPYPPRSPDLTCMDYYLWGRIKNMVYTEKPTTRHDMMDRIRNAVQIISGDEILRAVVSFENRIEKCIENEGRIFEHL